MLTVGGAISGYSAIGSVRCAMAPMMRMMIDRTEAKIGRSMKKWGKRICGSTALAQLLAALASAGSGLTFTPGTHGGIGDAVDDDAIARHRAR